MHAVIIAAGESSRFWPLNKRHKSLVKIMGRPLIWYTIQEVCSSGIKDVIIVQSPARDIEEELRRYQFPQLNIQYVIQQEAKGIGDALWQTRNLLAGPFLVLFPDQVGAGEIIQRLFAAQQAGADGAIAGFTTDQPDLFGMMRLEGERVLEIVEKPAQGQEPSKVAAAGLYALGPAFFAEYEKVSRHQNDFEEALSLYMRSREVKLVLFEQNLFVLKYPWHLFGIEQYLLQKHLKGYVDETAVISRNVILEGPVYVGKNVKIFENAVIKGPCYIGDNTVIGNNALIREYVNLERDVLIGAAAEVARSIFQEGSKTHSGFFGDSIFGEKSSVGTRSSTANVRLDRQEVRSAVKGEKVGTRLNSFGCIIGEHTSVGVNCSFMPGVLIGSGCLVGPHSVVFENIEDSTAYYAKFEKVIKKRLL
ncbi:MAG: NTP transferase domain-containing protein [Candidatus Wildermuthbacteria bacterium]|nr:NTP transferase domain-containing protein [Candidatus Wildermuthbacteria bacterium]